MDEGARSVEHGSTCAVVGVLEVKFVGWPSGGQ